MMYIYVYSEIIEKTNFFSHCQQLENWYLTNPNRRNTHSSIEEILIRISNTLYGLCICIKERGCYSFHPWMILWKKLSRNMLKNEINFRTGSFHINRRKCDTEVVWAMVEEVTFSDTYKLYLQGKLKNIMCVGKLTLITY